MDRLVKADVREVEICYKRNQTQNTAATTTTYTNSTTTATKATFRVTNLMHTMPVAISLTTTNPSIYSFTPQHFTIIPPLSSSSYTLVLRLPRPSDPPPFSSQCDVITVRSSMLPTGKASPEDLRRLFSRPGPHVFRDAILPITLVGPDVVDYLIRNNTNVPDFCSRFARAVSTCTGSQLTLLLKSAVLSGDPFLVSGLIDEGADINFKDPDGSNSVSVTVRTGNIDVLKVLTASGRVIHDPSINRLLHDAAGGGRVDLMKVLCANIKSIDINSIDSLGQTPMHIAASLGHVEVIQFCVSVGGDVDVLDSSGCSPLHLAAEKGHIDVVNCLLEFSEFVKYAVSKEGKTPFALAFENGHSCLYNSLQLDDSLHRAARKGDVSAIRSTITEGVNVNGRDQYGWTALHRAVLKGQLESVKVLLQHGARVDVVNDAGYTPLHCAIESRNVEVALLLISHGAKVNLKSLKSKLGLDSHCFKSLKDNSNMFSEHCYCVVENCI